MKRSGGKFWWKRQRDCLGRKQKTRCARARFIVRYARTAMTYLVLKYLHVIGAVVLLGTGAGIAFFMFMAHRSRDADHVFRTARTVVLADFLFTTTAVIAQPVTGVLLAREVGLPLSEPWLLISLILYVVTGAFWLPVVWIQMRMRDLAGAAARRGGKLGADYRRLFHLWFLCGIPAFSAVLVILWLMIAKLVW